MTFLPTSLLVHSWILSSPMLSAVTPGTTRGMLIDFVVFGEKRFVSRLEKIFCSNLSLQGKDEWKVEFHGMDAYLYGHGGLLRR